MVVLMPDEPKVISPAIQVDPDEVTVEVMSAEEVAEGDRILVEYDGSWWAVPSSPAATKAQK